MKTIYKEVYVVDVLNDKVKHIFDDIKLAEKYRNEQISIGRSVSDIYTEFMPFAIEEMDLEKENKELKEKISDYEKALNCELFINFKLPMEHTKLKREVEELKAQLAEKDKENKLLRDVLDNLKGDKASQKLVNTVNAVYEPLLKQRDALIRKQVCSEIREYIAKEYGTSVEDMPKHYHSLAWSVKDIYELLDQIEQGEQR